MKVRVQTLESSYVENNFGEVFYNTLLAHKPFCAVELGSLHGYSMYHIARALKENSLFHQVHGHLNAYDLWEDYPYNHGSLSQVEALLKEKKLDEFVSLFKADAFEVYKEYEDNSVEFLHVDISNTGEIFNKIFDQWDSKICCRGLFLFEGGSEERDQVEWMIKYNKTPIRPAILEHSEFNRRYDYGIYLKFPSLMVGIKKLNEGE